MDPFTEKINRERSLSRGSLRSREGENWYWSTVDGSPFSAKANILSKNHLMTSSRRACPDVHLFRATARDLAQKIRCTLKNGEPADRWKSGPPSAVQAQVPVHRKSRCTLKNKNPLNAAQNNVVRQRSRERPLNAAQNNVARQRSTVHREERERERESHRRPKS